jgi:hypothetical protein
MLPAEWPSKRRSKSLCRVEVIISAGRRDSGHYPLERITRHERVFNLARRRLECSDSVMIVPSVSL